MKIEKVIISVILMLTFLACRNENPPLTIAEEHEEIKGFVKNQAHLLVSRGLDAYAETWADIPAVTAIHAPSMDPGSVLYGRGKEVIVGATRKFVEDIDDLSWLPPEIFEDWNINIHGEMAWVTYVISHDVSFYKNKSYHVQVLQKEDGIWKSVLFSSMADTKSGTPKWPVEKYPQPMQCLIEHWQSEAKK